MKSTNYMELSNKIDKEPQIIAMYLPQYHEIPENNEFWGKGFSDWVTVKNARSLFKGHNQPRVPLNDNYYDLSLKENVAWQAKLAKDYGIDGLGIYHYWFSNEKNILTKPAEIILENKDIDMEFFFAWDNANWKRSWSNVAGNDWAPAMDKKPKEGEPIILIPYILGGEKDWENHYNWLRPFFKDKRYIKNNNKPIFIIFNYDEQVGRMCGYWEKMAMQDGFNGMYFIFRYGEQYHIPESEHVFKYEPLFSGWTKILPVYVRAFNKLRRMLGIKCGPRQFNYDDVWNAIIENTRKETRNDIFSGAFVTYDDTPRRGSRGTVIVNSSPAKFKIYFSQLVKICKKQRKDYIFLTAWNEWGEGAYLEPDERTGYGYLEVIKELKEEKYI